MLNFCQENIKIYLTEDMPEVLNAPKIVTLFQLNCNF